MTKEELRTEFLRLSQSNTKEDINDVFLMLKEYFLRSIMNHQSKAGENAALRDARIVNQMMFTKLMHLEQLIQGVQYTTADGKKLNNVIDATVVASSVRTLFETAGMFNCVYVQPADDDERLILYNLWAHAGLSYRQKFQPQIGSQESLQKAAEEKKQMGQMVADIEATQVWKGLSQRNKDKIYNKVSGREYDIRFDNGQVKGVGGFQELIHLAGVKTAIMGSMYTYFSLHAHPSNVAVFQFAQMFSAEKPEFFDLVKFNLRNAFMLLSIFVADYIKVFPEAIDTFNALPIEAQCVINYWNRFARGNAYVINESLNHLD